MASCSNPRPEIRPFWGACWALGLLGCQLVFGEYQAGHAAADSAGAPPTGGTAGAGGGAAGATAGSPAGAAPTGGSGNDCSGTPPYRCQPDATLQACTDGAWTTIDTCTRLALCQPALGVCDVCADGERNCSPSGELGICSADHTAFTLVDTCQGPLYCDPAADHCVACADKQAQCNGDYLAVCNTDRTAWDPEAQSCGTLGCHVVDGMADYCNDCSADSPAACSSSTTLQSCVSGKWRASECPNGCVATTPAVCLN